MRFKIFYALYLCTPVIVRALTFSPTFITKVYLFATLIRCLISMRAGWGFGRSMMPYVKIYLNDATGWRDFGMIRHEIGTHFLYIAASRVKPLYIIS